MHKVKNPTNNIKSSLGGGGGVVGGGGGGGEWQAIRYERKIRHSVTETSSEMETED